MLTTVFTNVLNEELLINHWLDHHIHMFDNGVVIDYGCRDNTISIIQKRCPTWKIIKNKYRWGRAYEDIEELENKEEYKGWKIALNVTEFLMTDDLKKFIENFIIEHPTCNGIRTCGVNIVSKNKDQEIITSEPLMKQLTYGFFEHNLPVEKFNNDTNVRNPGEILVKLSQFISAGIDGRTRLLHNTNNGMYNNGRHSTRLENIFPRSSGTCPESKLFVCWLGYAPYKIIESRKMQRRHTHLNFEHLYNTNLKVCHDLMDNQNYKEVYEKMYGKIE
jgi:hypothetical protein